MAVKSNVQSAYRMIVAATLALWGLIAILSPASAQGYARYAVLIVIDGCRPEYLEIAPLPHIAELAGRGITYDSAWVGQLATNTPPGHATLGTGTFPARHHVVNFRWKDPGSGKSFFPAGLEKIRSGALVDVISNAGVPSVPGLFKKAYPDACTLAMSSVKPYAALGMGNFGADYILFTPVSKKRKGGAWGEEGIEKGQVRHFEALSDHSVEQDILDTINSKIKPYEHAGDFDTWVVDAFLVMFEKKRPRLSMINLPETDEMGHKCGGISAPEAMKPVIKNVDVQIGRIAHAYKAAGIFENTLFVVTADHGMVPNAFNVSVGSYLEAFLGLQDFLQLGLTDPCVWLRKAARSEAVAKRIVNMNPPGIGAVFYKKHDVDKVSYHQCSPTGNGRSEPAWSYLLSTVACPYSPDIFLGLRENTVIGRKFPLNQRGKHYQGTWGTQHIPLIISGPGVATGIHSNMPARLVDIPPTLLALLGVGTSSMDGVVLADALKTPSSEQTRVQVETGTRLEPLQKALMNQSRRDLELVSQMPVSRFWNSLWLCDILAVALLGLTLFVIQRARLPRKVKTIGLSAGFLLLITSQAFFVLILQKMLEI
jgi:hypothetical protein